MEILVNVINQKLKATTNMKTVVAGTQEFVLFKFLYGDDWSTLTTFAQFTQNGNSYNVYLDENDSVYLPAEIVEGKCTVMLFGTKTVTVGGSSKTVRATTNLLEFAVTPNMLIANANSIQLTQSLYDQLVAKVNELLDLSNSDYSELISAQIATILAGYLDDGSLAAATIEDGSLPRSKVDSSFEATLQKADNSWQKSTSNTATPTEGSWEASYDPLGYGKRQTPIDPYSFAQSQDSVTVKKLRGIVLSNPIPTDTDGNNTFALEDSAGASHTYVGIDNAIKGAKNLANAYTNIAIQTALSGYVPFNIQIVTEEQMIGLMGGAGIERTFYLVQKNGGYEKYWYVKDQNDQYHWDNFGSSSTLVLATLPETGDEEIDYIVGSGTDYQYYKYINNEWKLIAGSNSVVITSYTYDGTTYDLTDVIIGIGAPSQSLEVDMNKQYIDSSTLDLYIPMIYQSVGANEQVTDSGSCYNKIGTLVTSPSETKDYYVRNGDLYYHFRYINGSFKQIGSDSYSKSETDAMLQAVSSSVSNLRTEVTGDINTIDAKVDALGNLVSDVTESADGITVHYKDGSSKNVATKDTVVKVEDLDILEGNAGIKVTYTDGSTKDLEISGGGGSASTGSATITRVTDASIQCVYGNDCNIQYRFAALDSAGDVVGNGQATWYVNNIKRATSEALQGVVNTFNIGEFLSVGANTVRLSITVDTGGETNTTTTKSWTINAINLYLTWDYLDTTVNTSDTVTLRWTPYGDLNKVTHIKIDGVERTDLQTSTTRSGVQQYVEMDKLSHGSHLVEMWLSATVNNTGITSSSIVHDMIFADTSETATIIACSLDTDTVTQYNTLQIPIVVYNPSSLTSTVTLIEDEATVATWTQVDRTQHYWNYTPSTSGEKVLQIVSGGTTKTINITVDALNINNEEVSGYTFRMKSSDITGNDALRSWASNGVNATFSNNFDWNNGGIKTETDEYGNIRQYICVKAGTTMTINHNLFSDDPTELGKTFKIIFKVENARDYDAAVASCYADSIGIQLFAHEAQFSSSGTSISVPYGEDEYIELEFDVYPAPTANNGSYRYMMAWIDGVITTCRVYGQSDNFTQSVANQQAITIGSADCDVYIYMVKAYPHYLTRDNHIENFIADAPNAQEMVRRYDRNNILDISGEIDYQKLIDNNPDCRVWLYDIPYMTVGKKDKVKNCTFNQFWKNGDKYYELSGSGTLTVQGTSSVDYLRGAANTDISFTSLVDGNGVNLMANGVVDEENYGKNYFVGNTSTGEVTVFTVEANTTLTPDCIPVERDQNGNVTKYIKALGYKINDGSTPITYSNTKVNFASCEQVNNICNAIWYQRYQPYQSLTPRDCMEFSMGVQFIKDSGEVPDTDHFVLFGDNKYHMYSIGNMGNSKKNVHVFHDLSNPNDCCIEVGNNLNDLCRMVDDDMSNSIWYGGSDKSFEMRYPDTDSPSQSIINGWQRLVSWMASRNPNAATGDALQSPETYGNYTFVGHDRGGTQVLKGTRVTQYAGTYTHDTFERRMAKMLSECEDYLVMDSVIYHFVYIERHTMCDNVAKNTFWASSDLLHWDLSKAYDMDTSDGNNNEGKMVFDYGNEADDVIGSKTVFNANDAVWFVFASNLYEACQTMFVNREAAGAWSATAYHNFFLEQQRKIPERVWVQCYWYDYLRTYEQNISDAWIEFLDGGQKTHQRWHYEYFEEIYDSSKYRGTSCTVQNINFRGYYPSRWDGLTNEQWELLQPKAEIKLKMYNKCYINVSIDGTIYRQKANRGTLYTIDFSNQSKLNDTVINIYSAQMIQEIGDISRLYPGTPNFANAVRLRSLTIGSPTTGYTNSNLTGVTLGNNSMLEYLYVQNLAHITSGLDLSNCQALLYLDASGSSFTGYDFATGGLLETAYIEAPTSLTLRNLYYLEDENLHVTSYANLDTLRIENCEGLNTLSIISSATNLARLRLLGIDWTLAETTVLNRLLNLLGLNENGNNVPKSVLTGAVYISGSLRNQELSSYQEAWDNLTITYNVNNLINQYLISYVNADSENTVLFTQYFDQGAYPTDPYDNGDIPKPTIPSTDQYDFEFSGWNTLSQPVIANRNIVATYTNTVKKYTVNFYQREGVLLKSFTNIDYGSEVVYDEGIPTWTDGESSYQYRIFKGWDKSTGFIRSNLNVYAIWDTASTLPSAGTSMNDMTVAQIYSVGKAGYQSEYFEDGDYVDIQLGHDFDFSNVEAIEIGKDITLTGIQRDTFVSGGYYFDGNTAFTTDIKLFAEDSPAFTMAIDFQLNSSTSGATIFSTHEGNTSEGIRFYFNGSVPTIQWGDQFVTVGYQTQRDIVVIRHPKGSKYLFVYTAGNNNTGRFAPNVTKTTVLRTNTTQTDEPLTFGGIHYSTGYRNYGKGTMHWCKIWMDDLGDTNAFQLASWVHETIRMEYWGAGKYYYDDTSIPCLLSFICNSQLDGLLGRGYWMNSTNTNVGGWHSSAMRAFLNDRFFKAMPTVWQAVIRAVEIRATAGNKSTEIVTDFDKIYLPSYRELDRSITTSGYIEEVGTSNDSISWFTNNPQRIKFRGKTRKYAGEATIYTCNQEPAALYQTDIEPGTIWINTSSSSTGYIFVSQDEIDQYGKTPTIAADSTYAQGGWFVATLWWGRSPVVGGSSGFMFVGTGGGAGGSGGANAMYGVVPGFSL